MYRQESSRPTSGQELNKSLGKAFITALLLTGSVEQAEAAVLEGIRLLDLDNDPGEALLSQTVSAAIEAGADIRASPEGLTGRSSILPLELHAVMYLPSHIRHCFVLRVLLGWSREISARILQLEIPQINERTRIAILRLAYINDVFLSTPRVLTARASSGS